MKLNIKELKELMTKISLAIEKSKINPKSSWIELETIENRLSFKVANYDYYLEASISLDNEITSEDYLHATILSETFAPLVAKLDVEYVNIYEKLNSLILETDNSSYTFPIIKELGKTRKIDEIPFTATTEDKVIISGNNLSSVARINTKGILGAMFSQEIQQYIYVDETGALTFTENIYINEFKEKVEGKFKLLLNVTQAKLLEIFSGIDDVKIEFEHLPTYGTTETVTNKICASADNIKLVLITKDKDYTDKFPAIKIRTLGSNENQTHVIVDKKQLDRALSRLMVFDKKFDITVMDYSKLVFKENEVELVSIKNKNIEKIPYISSSNAVEHESIIRFADLVEQLKAITSKEIDISYGERQAIVINSNVKQLIPEIRIRTGV